MSSSEMCVLAEELIYFNLNELNGEEMDCNARKDYKRLQRLLKVKAAVGTILDYIDKEVK